MKNYRDMFTLVLSPKRRARVKPQSAKNLEGVSNFAVPEALN
ncbi:MAG: hypothetical protein N0A00_03140 [Candidatus Bathyarchaeota archaeon]|nr:hypothetical protein [Candidatus Bathyarchaeota archaeon]